MVGLGESQRFLPSRLTHLSKGLKKPLRAAMHDVGASISPRWLRRSGRGLRECAVLPRPSRHRRRGVARRPHCNGCATISLPSGLHSSQGAVSLLTGLSKKDLGTHLGVQDKQVKAWEEGALESGPAIAFSKQHEVLRLYQQHWRDARRLAMLRDGAITVTSPGSRAVKGFHPLGTTSCALVVLSLSPWLSLLSQGRCPVQPQVPARAWPLSVASRRHRQRRVMSPASACGCRRVSSTCQGRRAAQRGQRRRRSPRRGWWWFSRIAWLRRSRR
eukprot:COSAG04_NODE_1442_length_6755_cov_3.734225_7_plen_273_part_00